MSGRKSVSPNRGHAVDGALRGRQRAMFSGLGSGNSAGNGLPGVDTDRTACGVADELGAIATQPVANAVEHALIDTLREGRICRRLALPAPSSARPATRRAAVVVDVAGHSPAQPWQKPASVTSRQGPGGDQVVDVGRKVWSAAVPADPSGQSRGGQGDGAEAAFRR